MGAELEARAMSHLELVSDAAIKARIPQLEQLLPQLSKKLRHRSWREKFHLLGNPQSGGSLWNLGGKSMAAKKTAAVILPTTAYILKLVPPPVRQMIQENVVVALCSGECEKKEENGSSQTWPWLFFSDYNPNVPCFSMPFVMHLGCILCKMTMEEAFNAATINSAFSLGLTVSWLRF